jgi:acyl phosphate:glycerol-3-phosphate acyltransferase
MAFYMDIASVVTGYLLGSIPSAYLLGRLWGKTDLRKEGDGHISATAVYRYSGWGSFILVVLMDFGKGVLAVYLAALFSDSVIVYMVTAYAAVIGHCWSVFLRFKGGLGGIILFSVLASLVPREAAVGLIVSLLILFSTRKSSWATYLIQATASMALFVELYVFNLPQINLALCLFPLGLIVLHLLKRFQTSKVNPATTYKHELFDDLKRITKNK